MTLLHCCTYFFPSLKSGNIIKVSLKFENCPLNSTFVKKKFRECFSTELSSNSACIYECVCQLYTLKLLLSQSSVTNLDLSSGMQVSPF